MNHIQIQSGDNDVLTAVDGQRYVDLITGYGAVLLGHCCRPVVERVQQQLGMVWSTARLDVPIVEEATKLVTSTVGNPHRLVQLCSSGNEATELALRIAAVVTGRKSFVGFARSMHGKSIAASAMSWSNEFADLRGFRTLPFVDVCQESEILEQMSTTLSTGDVAGVFVEPIQGTNGAQSASISFYQQIRELCQQHGCLFIVDEVLTGFYRSGALSYVKDQGLDPDIVIFGKAMGNGFPVAAVLCHEDISISAAMLPGSTFSDSPLAAAAVVATIEEMERIDVAARCEAVHKLIKSRLQDLGDIVELRGSGALWVLEMPTAARAIEVQADAFRANVLVSANDRFVRLLPPATISTDNLDRAVDAIAGACRRAQDA